MKLSRSWKTLSRISNVSSAISDMADKVKKALEPLKAISFDNLIISLDNLKRAAQPLTDKLFAGLELAYYNIFVPFSFVLCMQKILL